jgi:uncharacterized protein
MPTVEESESLAASQPYRQESFMARGTSQKMTKILILLLNFYLLVGSAFAASFDCGKAQTVIEKVICEEPALSHLDEQLGALYLKVRDAAVHELKPQIIREQREWLRQRNRQCGDADIDCLKSIYSEQIHWLTNIPPLYAACEKIQESLKPGTIELENGIEVAFTTDKEEFESKDFYDSDYYLKLSTNDKDLLRNKIHEGYYVFAIAGDINEDALPDVIIYQVMGTGHCLTVNVLMRQPDSSLKLATLPAFWESEESYFCGSSIGIFNVGEDRWIGTLETVNRGAGITLYANSENTIGGGCSILLNNSSAFKVNKELDYHQEFNWVEEHLSELTEAINKGAQKEYAFDKLAEVIREGADENRFHFYVDGATKPEVFRKTAHGIEILMEGGDFLPLNEFWDLKDYADKFKPLYRTYNALNKHDAQVVFFRGSDGQYYFLYWSNAEFGWRQSDDQILFLYRLVHGKPEYLDTLLLEAETYYEKDTINCFRDE